MECQLKEVKWASTSAMYNIFVPLVKNMEQLSFNRMSSLGHYKVSMNIIGTNTMYELLQLANIRYMSESM